MARNYSATVRAHPNIALAKYWGKAPGGFNAPAVPSLSVTLAGMTTETTVTFAPEFAHDTLRLNGAPAPLPALARAVLLLDRVRALAGIAWKAEVTSHNDFPTAAGLASSASGFAALALASTRAAGLTLNEASVSDLARRSSASSARSIFGGFVELAAGRCDVDEPLPAHPVAPSDHLALGVLIAVTTEATKDVASTAGMNHTATTSPFYAAWLQHAPQVFQQVKDALLARDLPRLGDAAEASALAMHASALAAQPGILYWNGTTVAVLHAVRELRATGVGAWATIDAGPHVKVLHDPADEVSITRVLRAVAGVTRVLATRPGPGAAVVPTEAVRS